MEWNTASQIPRGPYSGANTVISASAPNSSKRKMPFRINPVNRTMPPTWGAEMASCMVLRCISVIRLPEAMVMATATVTTPMPPIWMSSSITACPKTDQWVAVSYTTSPVTQTAEVEVNRQSRNGVLIPAAAETGSISSSAPTRMTIRKPKRMICEDVSFLLCKAAHMAWPPLSLYSDVIIEESA